MKEVLVSLLVFLTAASAVLIAQESVADRELLGILEMQAELVEASEGGAGEETLLIRSQRIADRYEGFLERNPDHLHGWILCGKFLRSVGADARALAAFRKARSLAPGMAVVYEQMGLTLAAMEESEAALGFLLRAVELDPEEPVYREDLGNFLMRFGDKLETEGVLEPGRALILASESYGEAFRLEPGFDRGWLWAESLGDLPKPDWEETAGAWAQVRELAVSEVEKEAARLQQARALIESGDQNEARILLEPVETPALRSSREQLLQRLED